MRIFRVIVPVGDIAAAEAFYAQVLGRPGRQVSPGRRYFDCEGVILACYDAAADGDEATSAALSEPLYLAVDDLEACFEACRRAGASFPTDAPPEVGPMGEIASRPWGERSFYAADPFGNALCFVARSTVFTGA